MSIEGRELCFLSGDGWYFILPLVFIRSYSSGEIRFTQTLGGGCFGAR